MFCCESLKELFEHCEVTFAGKCTAWRDDVSFHPPLAGARPPPPPSSLKANPLEQQPEGGEKVGQLEPAVTARGRFWRNLNRDRGWYTLTVEGEGEGGSGGGGKAGETAVLDLNWDRWENQVLVLKERGVSGLWFEGGWEDEWVGGRVAHHDNTRVSWVSMCVPTLSFPLCGMSCLCYGEVIGHGLRFVCVCVRACVFVTVMPGTPLVRPFHSFGCRCVLCVRGWIGVFSVPCSITYQVCLFFNEHARGSQSASQPHVRITIHGFFFRRLDLRTVYIVSTPRRPPETSPGMCLATTHQAHAFRQRPLLLLLLLLLTTVTNIQGCFFHVGSEIAGRVESSRTG